MTAPPRKKPTPKDVARVKAKAKPAEPKKLHVKIELKGSLEFDLEGEQAEGLQLLLDRGADAEEILGTLDPWSSGVKVTQEIEIHPPPSVPGGSVVGHKVFEEAGTVCSWVCGTVPTYTVDLGPSSGYWPVTAYEYWKPIP